MLSRCSLQDLRDAVHFKIEIDQLWLDWTILALQYQIFCKDTRSLVSQF